MNILTFRSFHSRPTEMLNMLLVWNPQNYMDLNRGDGPLTMLYRILPCDFPADSISFSAKTSASGGSRLNSKTMTMLLDSLLHMYSCLEEACQALSQQLPVSIVQYL